MIDFYFDDDYDDLTIKGVNRARKIEKQKDAMKVNSAGLIKVTLPIIAKKAREAKRKREEN